MNRMYVVHRLPLMGLVLTLAMLGQGQALAQEGEGRNTQSSSGAGEPSSDIRAAYQREYAFLVSQREELRERLAEFRQQSRQDREAIQAEIDRLQAAVIDLESRADALQERIEEAEREAETARRNEDILASTFQQANVTFEEHEGLVDAPESDGGSAQLLASVFEQGLELVRARNRTRIEEGSFFTREGDKVDGRLIHLGGIATFGVSDSVAGILVPAGGGEWTLWKEPHSQVARSLAEGNASDLLPLYIYGSANNQVETSAEGGPIATIQKGGLIAWLIMGLAVLALGLIVARIVFLHRASRSTATMVDSVGDLVRQRKIQEAIDVCRRASGSTAAVIAAALRNIGRDRESLDDIVNEAILHESSHLERFGAFILVIAAVSPLLGLLGTVTGMISTFEVITEHGTGDPQLLSGGISVALITTELGLIVAIPTLLVGNVLSGWAERIKDDMQKAALRVTNLYEESRPGRGE